MNKNQQKEHIEDIFNKMRETLLAKGDDYANEDRLSNFKFVGQITNTKPEKVALIMAAIKIARLGVLLDDDKSPNHESINDSVLDLANYAVLMEMVVSDKEGQKSKLPVLVEDIRKGVEKSIKIEKLT